MVDFGIRGLDLTYALLDGYDAVILVDATPRGGAPGTIYVLEPEAASQEGPAAVEPHNLDPVKVLRLAATMGARVGRLLVVGCEPSPVDDVEEMRDGLSEPVRAAVDEAARVVESLTAKLLGEAGAAGAAGAGEENAAAVMEGQPCP